MAQDERRVASPDGRLEFRVFIAKPDDAILFRLAYQVFYQGKPLIDTSFLGLELRNQEPMLGENVGLIGMKTSKSATYNSLTAEYMQNGSLGRLINVEVRVWNNGLAFRYVLPWSSPLRELLIDDEITEFDLTPTGAPLTKLNSNSRTALPFAVEKSGLGWVAIDEAGSPEYPRTYLARTDGSVLITRLAHRGEGDLAFDGAAPLTCPWRVLTIGSDREHAMNSPIAAELSK